MFHLVYKKKKILEESPLSTYKKVRGANSSLLYTGLGRYAVLGYQPFMAISSKDFKNHVKQISYTDVSVEEDVRMVKGEPLDFLQATLDGIKVSGLSKLPKDFPPFKCGAIGYFSYDYGRVFYGIESEVVDDIDTPDMYFAFYDKSIIFDLEKGEMYVIAFAESKSLAEALVLEIEEDIAKGLSYDEGFSAGDLGDEPKSNLTKSQYKKKIAKIKKKLKDGETYQVNFSQRFSCSYGEDPLKLFEKLWKLNPSLYSCFIEGDDLKVISCSPERLFAVQDGKIDVRPIKGTVPRGGDDSEDEERAAELLDSKKDDAELSMIVDLYRNDIGKICKAGTVEVLEHRKIEKYSHVIHTVSVVQGLLREGVSLAEIVRAMFPGGSITGCPKKRTISIINELEDFARGLYCGSAGYISFDGSMDFNILIRTFAYLEGNLYFHGGGGIVIDSDVELEYKEAFDKVMAMIEAVK